MLAVLIHEGSSVRVITPYNAEFVTALKQIPYESKSFDRDQKCWFVDEDYAELLEQIAQEFFRVEWYISEREADKRVSAARAAAQRNGPPPRPTPSHSTEQCLNVVKTVYREEAALGLLPPVESEGVLRAVYRALALQHHPDIAGAASTATMVRVNAAYDLLLKRCKVKSA